MSSVCAEVRGHAYKLQTLRQWRGPPFNQQTWVLTSASTLLERVIEEALDTPDRVATPK